MQFLHNTCAHARTHNQLSKRARRDDDGDAHITSSERSLTLNDFRNTPLLLPFISATICTLESRRHSARESGSCKTVYAPRRDCRDDAPTQASMCLCVFVFVLYREFSVLPLATTTTTPPPTERKIRRLMRSDDDNIIAARYQFLVISRMTCPAFPWGVRTHTHTFWLRCIHISRFAANICKSVEPVNGNISAASFIFEWTLWNILIRCKLMYFDPKAATANFLDKLQVNCGMFITTIGNQSFLFFFNLL